MENFVDNVENFLNTINADKKGNLKRNKNFSTGYLHNIQWFSTLFAGLSTNLDKVIHKM